MKIKLPNPDDYSEDTSMFFEQLELCVHHARKAWEKIVKSFNPEDEQPYITFRIPFLQKDYEKYSDILDQRAEQDIDIEINTP